MIISQILFPCWHSNYLTCVLEPSKGKKNYVITLHNMQNPLKNPNTHLNITNLDSWSQNAFIRCRLHKL